jgi:hypothetical protein
MQLHQMNKLLSVDKRQTALIGRKEKKTFALMKRNQSQRTQFSDENGFSLYKGYS